jgi:hypothetical protein
LSVDIEEEAMTARPIATAFVLGAMLATAGCSGADSGGRSGSSVAPTPEAAEPAAGPLVGAFQTPTISLTRMAEVAKAAGFKQKDIDDYLSDNFGDARNVVYTLRLTEDQWVAFVTIDGGSAEETWSGPYELVDASTVRAGAPPCGPITYGYALQGDVLSLDLKDDDCPGPDGEVPAGELIAQTTIYETGPFTRVG